MKKRTRLAFLMLALGMSSLAVPGAFAKGGGGRLSPARPNTGAIHSMTDYTILCLDGRATPCSGSYEYCVGYCDGYCGGGQGSCA